MTGFLLAIEAVGAPSADLWPLLAEEAALEGGRMEDGGASFDDAGTALRAAVSIQRSQLRRNQGVPEALRCRLRLALAPADDSAALPIALGHCNPDGIVALGLPADRLAALRLGAEPVGIWSSAAGEAPILRLIDDPGDGPEARDRPASGRSLALLGLLAALAGVVWHFWRQRPH